MTHLPTVAIVGAGFSGTLTAVHLLWRGGGVRVVLFNSGETLGPGLAYGTPSAAHLLNVVAGRMSAFADDEDSFLRFARTHDAALTGGSFVPRKLYGAYLQNLLTEAEAGGRGVLERVADEVVAIDPIGSEARLTTAGGQTFFADHVVLAMGNAPPLDPPLADQRAYAHPRYIRDPWASGALGNIRPNESVLLLGTGLTMLDVALQLRDLGVGSMQAVSRRGLLPQSHRSPSRPPSLGHRPPRIEAGPATARAYLGAVRRQVKQLAAEGIDWREVINSLRPITPRLWKALSNQERARFVRHVRAYWETHRHRAAPEVLQGLEQLMAAGQLQLRAGRLRQLTSEGTGLRAEFEQRDGTQAELSAAWVVNCTGPATDVRRLESPLVQQLLADGLLRPDPLALGIDTAENGALLDRHDVPSDVLSYVGPLLRARLWESTAVPELRLHAANLAQTLIDRFARLVSATRRSA